MQPAIVVYGLADARAAAAAAAALDIAVTVRVPAAVAAGLGADVIGALFARVRAEVPVARITAAVDCADAPGLALALLRRGIDRVRIDAGAEARRRIADIAARSGAALDDAKPDAGPDMPGQELDLLHVDDPASACETWLRGFKTSHVKPNCQ